MKQKFKLSKSNMIFFGVVAIISTVLFATFFEMDSTQTSEFAGGLLAFLLFPTLIAWIAWRSSGRKEKGGSFAFNLTLALMLFGQIGQFRNKLQPSQNLNVPLELQKELKEKISNADDPAEIDSAYNEFTDSVINELNRLSKTGTAEEKQFYRIMGEFASETQTIVQNWSDSYDAVLSPKILDYSRLNSDEEFDRQRAILKHYVEKTKVYDEFFSNMIPNLTKRLSVLGDGKKYAKEAVNGATRKYLSQKPIVEPLNQAHLEYGRNMIRILALLQQNTDEWAYENGELLIYSEKVLNEYNELIEALGRNEASILTLSRKLTEAM